MAGFNYTPDQRMAMEFPGNVIVSAGAGSGKTRILVERYIRLLTVDHPTWPVEYVVAITFTRKAAAELKSRIVDTVLEMLAEETEESERWHRLKEIRNAVGAAPIGTIHNFCGRLLREFAYDAHVDPDFAVLEGAEEASTKLKAVRATVAHAAAGSNELMYRALLRLMTMYSGAALENILSGMLGKRSTFLRAAERFAETEVEKLWAELQEFHREIVEPLREEFKNRWLAILQNLDGRSEAGVVRDAVERALDCWKQVKAECWADYEEIIEVVRGALLTAKGTCRKREFAKAGFEEFDGIRDELEQLAADYSKVNLGEPGEADRLDLERSRDLAVLFLYAVEEYARLRGGDEDEGEAQLLDYEDMELLAGRLLSSGEDVVARIRKSYPYLIIDEFQDTSQSQWEILSPLVTDENGKLLPACLFIVGDKKQGVYGFREANVNLFSQLQMLVPESNEEWNGCRGTVSMRANFRSHKDTLSYINQTFERLLGDPANPYSVDFEPLEAYCEEGEGRIEYLMVEGSAEEGESGEELPEDADELEAGEAELVAAHINELLKQGKYKPGDIALLFRKRATFQQYEEAIKRYGIPVVSQQATNLFHQPELADVMAALEVIAYPHKDLAFMHYLRCASIGFEDNLLLKIARSRGRSFYDKARLVLERGTYQLDDQFYDISPSEKRKLTYALNLLDKARRMVGHYTPYHIVKFVIDQMGIYFSVLADYRGKQAQANLDKMLHQAHLGSGLSFEDFLEYLDSEKQTMAGVGEAIDLGVSDAVKIMTIHASKGLEFPVVYLPGMNSGTGGQPDTVCSDGECWMSVRISSSLMETSSFLMNHFAQIAKEQQKAEERRIFYVAMTRCKHLLVLSADEGKKARGETFYQWIADDFETARDTKAVKLLDAYPDIAKVQSRPAETTEEKPDRAGRQERINRALQLAGQLKREAPDESQVVVAQVTSPLSFYIESVMPGMIRMILSEGGNEALARYCGDRQDFPLPDDAWSEYQAFCYALVARLNSAREEGRIVRVETGMAPLDQACHGIGFSYPVLGIDSEPVWVSTSAGMDELFGSVRDGDASTETGRVPTVWLYSDLVRSGGASVKDVTP